nr:MAG TPA: hypothetical protein [Caudoviricetes sp.]
MGEDSPQAPKSPLPVLGLCWFVSQCLTFCT